MFRLNILVSTKYAFSNLLCLWFSTLTPLHWAENGLCQETSDLIFFYALGEARAFTPLAFKHIPPTIFFKKRFARWWPLQNRQCCCSNSKTPSSEVVVQGPVLSSLASWVWNRNCVCCKSAGIPQAVGWKDAALQGCGRWNWKCSSTVYTRAFLFPVRCLHRKLTPVQPPAADTCYVQPCKVHKW